jgi:hypothetical protein
MVFGGSAMTSANSWKTYIVMRLCSQRCISNPMRGSLFYIITFIGPLPRKRRRNAAAVRKAFPITM